MCEIKDDANRFSPDGNPRTPLLTVDRVCSARTDVTNRRTRVTVVGVRPPPRTNRIRGGTTVHCFPERETRPKRLGVAGLGTEESLIGRRDAVSDEDFQRHRPTSSAHRILFGKWGGGCVNNKNVYYRQS